MKTIALACGSGGQLTQELISSVFVKAFHNPQIDAMDDAGFLSLKRGEYAFSTDSYVIDPIFFPGADIGKLAVCGTLNDLASCGARPLYLSCGFILEEGLLFRDLERVVSSMAREAKQQGVTIVTGDTKVVPRGKADKIFINTSGIGTVEHKVRASRIRPQDQLLVSGNVGEHGLSVLLAREAFSFKGRIKSDCNSLWNIVELLLQEGIDIHFMRDPTRGGLSAATNEIAGLCGHSMVLHEEKIPVSVSCRQLSDILGLEILDIANEGKMLFILAPQQAQKALSILRSHPLGKDASIIGEVLAETSSKVFLKTSIGGEKILSSPMSEPIPRIC